jgi:hypothetical protein
MNTKTHKLKNDSAHTQGICKKWLSAPNLIILGLLLLFPMLHVRSAGAAEINETKMGEALMQMEEGATDAMTRAASEGWRTCEVKMTGAGWGNIYLRLVCNGVSEPERWFIARKDKEKEMLAAGLTAISLNKKVQVYLEHKPTAYHKIRACYVLQ